MDDSDLQRYLALIQKYEEVAAYDDGNRRQFSVGDAVSRVYFFGGHHVRDVSHPMFHELCCFADEAKPDLILIEGRTALRSAESEEKRSQALRQFTQGTIDQVTQRGGEPAFMAHYGARRGIRVESPEPLLSDEIQYVFSQGFSRDGVAAYYLYRMIYQWKATPASGDLQEYLARTISELRSLTAFAGYDWSWLKIESLSEQFWGFPFSVDRLHEYTTGLAPLGSRLRGTGTEVNEVCAASAYFRDLTIATEIISARKRASSILVVYGSGHAFTLQRALTAAFSDAVRDRREG